MTIYQDTSLGGVWHFCAACLLAGDGLELAAACWEVEPAEAADRLAGQGLLTVPRGAIGDYLTGHVGRRRETADLWLEASRTPPRGAGVRVASKFLGMGQVEPLFWQRRGGRLAGAVDAARVTEWYGRVPFGRRHRRPHSGEVLLSPLHDLPGRISGFLVLASGIDDELLTTFLPSTPGRRAVGVLGAAALQGEAGGRLDEGTLLVVPDVVAAMRMQLNQLHAGYPPLPLVGAVLAGEVPPALTELIGHRRPVLWADGNDADLFATARRLDADVLSASAARAATGVSPAQISQLASRLRAAVGTALPWREALVNRLPHVPLSETLETLRHVGLTDDEVDDLAAACGPAMRARLTALCSNRHRDRGVTVDRARVVEDAGGWRLAVGGEVVSEAVLRVDRVIASGGRVWYDGRVLFAGTETPYTVLREEILPDPLGFAVDLVVRAGRGYPRHKRGWRSRGMELATAFHRPETVAFAGYGWDPTRQEFVTPDYAVTAAGVRRHGLPRMPPDAGGMPPLPEPWRPTAYGMDALLRPETAATVWPVLMTVLHNVTAPVFGAKPVGTAVCGDNFADLVPVAVAAGCRQTRLGAGRRGRSPEDRLAAHEPPGWWPAVFTDAPTRRGDWCRWLSLSPHNGIVRCEPFAADALFVNGGWFLAAGRPGAVDEETRRAVSAFVPDFLRFTLARRFGGGGAATPVLARLTGELRAYVADAGGSDELLSAALASVVTDRGRAAADRLGRLLTGLVAAGRGSLKVYREAGDLVSVSVAEVNEQLARRQLPRLQPDAAASALRRAGVLAGDTLRRGKPRWLIDSAWWQAHDAAVARRAAPPSITEADE